MQMLALRLGLLIIWQAMACSMLCWHAMASGSMQGCFGILVRTLACLAHGPCLVSGAKGNTCQYCRALELRIAPAVWHPGLLHCHVVACGSMQTFKWLIAQMWLCLVSFALWLHGRHEWTAIACRRIAGIRWRESHMYLHVTA